ncbi:MAG: pilus (MSHA type) biogenesis protein MshL [Thermodesulfobacteriota bacterium]
MKLKKQILPSVGLILFLLFLASCSPQTVENEGQAMNNSEPAVRQQRDATLPVQYQKPSYRVDLESKDIVDAEEEDATLRVGASIRSTQGPQPLWDILKRVAALKSLNVSWASDVDQNVLVDVDIKSKDDFYLAIENLLRQVDYYHEMQGSTIIVKYRESKQYRIAMPFTKQLYETGTGGNVLGSNDSSSNIEGTIRLDSKGNEFHIWQTIQDNMDAILDTWATTAVTATTSDENSEEEPSDTSSNAVEGQATRRVSAGGNMYTIDKPVGLITVHAPRPLQEKLEVYFDSLKNELYKQISIEAKIIEVQLTDNSSIGINWSQVLKNFSVDGLIEFGSAAMGGQIFPYVHSDYKQWTGTSPSTHFEQDIPVHGSLHDPTRFVSKIALNSQQFTVFLNALQEQGDTQVLSNPKLSVLNGQPALLTVGRNVTYVDSIEVDIDSETGLRTYSAETERILSGVGMALTANILDDKEIIMSLVPVTSELQEPIEYRQIGEGEVGLPVVNVREMSTTVRVKDGEMLVIGGLISNVEQTEGEFLPVLGSIPLIRYLFGYEQKVNQKRELIILLKPRII